MPLKINAALAQLHEEIDARVQAIRRNCPDWLCGKGCDSCCRRLAEVPQMTAAEWDLLQEGLALLSPQRLQELEQQMVVLSSQRTRPLICPLLDSLTGACPVYLWRPVACRTYGFYVERALGLYCGEIESGVANGILVDVVWGNQEAIDRRLAALGETRALTEWFRDWMDERAACD